MIDRADVRGRRRPRSSRGPRRGGRGPRAGARARAEPALRRPWPGQLPDVPVRGARPRAGLDEEHRHRCPQRPLVGGTAHGRLDLVAGRRAVRLVVVLRGERRAAGGAGSEGRAASGCSARPSTPSCWCSSSSCSPAPWCSRRSAVRCGGEVVGWRPVRGGDGHHLQRRRQEDVFVVEAQLGDALADVVEGAVGAGLVRACRWSASGYQRRDQLLDAAHVDAAVVQPVLDLGEVLVEEPTVHPDRVATERHPARFGHVRT